jgi:carboxypeptidase C (cathepsin A)
MRVLVGLVLLAAVSAAAPQVKADDVVAEPVAAPVTTHHREHVGGASFSYSATAGEFVLEDNEGKPAATIFSTSYVRDDVRDVSKRPVLFLFNGGPGSASHQLHAALGPIHSSQSIDVDAPADAATGKLVPNPYSILDATDLVFIDPVGTGYSRLLPGGDGHAYWNVAGDANAVLTFIRAWLQENGRGASPKFIAGESYGGVRLATLLNSADDLKLSGAIFLSPMLDLTASMEAQGNDLPYIVALPTMAADAWYQNKIDRNGRTVEETFKDTQLFADTDYAAALFRGSELPETDRRRIAHEVAERIGVSDQFVLDNNLRIPVRSYVVALLADKKMRIGQLDGRYVGVASDLAKNRPPFDDPSMAPGDDIYRLFPAYFASLGFETARPYVGLAMEVNLHWDWSTLPPSGRGYASMMPSVTGAMHRNPDLRLMVASGYYDLSTPLGAVEFALDHADLPRDRVTTAFFEAGHSVYRNAEVNALLSAKIREFIRGTAH